MKIIKRDGREVEFDKNKITNAITRAIDDNDKLAPNIIETISTRLACRYRQRKRATSVEEIQDDIETELMKEGMYETAKSYIRYRHKKELIRKSNTTDDRILSLINQNNEEIKQENSNKNPTIVSVQRDYMAGEVSKDLTNRILLPQEIVDAHNDGIIHFHDADYYAQTMHNCLDKSTRFITSKGVKSFTDFKDGDITTVLTKSGEWKKAIVKCYGIDDLYEFKIYDNKKENANTVIATANHRWYLNDGTITTNLSPGDKLVKAPILYDQDKDYEYFNERQKLLWCKGFALGDGTVEYYKAGTHATSTRVRLCGEKNNSLIERFNIDGCKIREQKFYNGDTSVVVYNYQKEIPELNSVDDIKAFINGLYCADGRMPSKNTNEFRAFSLQSSKKEVIDFIRDFAPVCGLYITKENDLTGERTNYTEERPYTILFSFNPNFKHHYTVLEKNFYKTDEVWCLEVEDEHNFVLANGIVTGNCCLVNLEDMLQNGTIISGTMIEKPHSFSTACTIATQIIAQVASCQYGGQSISLAHLAPFVDISRQKIREEVEKEFQGTLVSKKRKEIIVNKRLKEEVEKGIQTIQYQVITLQTTNGQAPFITLFMYLREAKSYQEKYDLAMLIEEVLRQRIRGVKNEKGVWITPAFPKLIYVLEDENVDADSPFYYLTELAAKCTAKRLVPDYISEKIMLQNKVDDNGNGNCFPCMGCRSFLTPYLDENNKPKYYGRWNQGVVTINLVDVALSANRDITKFWEILDERLELCHRALRCRHERLIGTMSDVAPILWQHGALSRLNRGETIDKYLYNGYSTISLGYAGLWECVYALNGKKLTESEGESLGLAIMKTLNEYTNKWKNAENIAYSPYGTPLESTTYKFAKCLQKRFGIIEGVTDHNYITNSYHINVREEVDAFSKLSIESKFQALSQGGAISYVEVPNLQNNPEAVLTVMRFIYDNIMYAELNTKSDYCQKCGYDGEIKIVEEDDGKLIWECPNCGNRDQNTMNVTRRTCG